MNSFEVFVGSIRHHKCSLEANTHLFKFINYLMLSNIIIILFYALLLNKLIFHCSSIFFYYSEECNCYAGVSMTLTLFCSPAHYNKHNVTFIKQGTNDVNMMTSWRYGFPRYKVFGWFSLKETEKLLKIKIYFTRDHRKS